MNADENTTSELSDLVRSARALVTELAEEGVDQFEPLSAEGARPEPQAPERGAQRAHARGTLARGERSRKGCFRATLRLRRRILGRPPRSLTEDSAPQAPEGRAQRGPARHSLAGAERSGVARAWPGPGPLDSLALEQLRLGREGIR